MDDDLKDALSGLYAYGITPIFEPGGMMDIIRNQSLVAYPIFSRRVDYFDLKRSENESVLEYLHKMITLSFQGEHQCHVSRQYHFAFVHGIMQG